MFYNMWPGKLEVTVEEGQALRQLINHIDKNDKEIKDDEITQIFLKLVKRKTGKDLTKYTAYTNIFDALMLSQLGEIKESKSELIKAFYNKDRAYAIMKQVHQIKKGFTS